MKHSTIVCVTLIVIAAGPTVRGDDSEEVKRLKEKIELLELKLKVASQEIADLKKTKQPDKLPAKVTLSDLMSEGKIVTGDYFSKSTNGKGDMSITITDRIGNKYKGSTIIKSRDRDAAALEYSIEGVIDGESMTVVSVGAAIKLNMKLSLKGESLEGKWTNTAGGGGTAAFKVSK